MLGMGIGTVFHFIFSLESDGEERGGTRRYFFYIRNPNMALHCLQLGCPNFASKKVSLQSETKRNAT